MEKFSIYLYFGNDNMISKKDLYVFIQSVHSMNFANAASILGMTPSAVGKIILKIENIYSIKLFNRNTRNISLTEDGEIFYNHAKNIINEFNIISKKLSHEENKYKGKLKVSCPNLDEIFVKLFSKFLKIYPDINLDLTLDDDYVDIVKDGYDIVIRFGYISDSRLFSKKIGKIKMNIFYSSKYDFEKDLFQNHFLFYKYPSSGKIESWNNIIPINISQVQNYSTYNSILIIKKLCCSAMGLAYLPQSICQKEIQHGELLQVENTRIVYRDVNLVWSQRKNSNSKINAFIDFFVHNWDIE